MSANLKQFSEIKNISRLPVQLRESFYIPDQWQYKYNGPRYNIDWDYQFDNGEPFFCVIVKDPAGDGFVVNITADELVPYLGITGPYEFDGWTICWTNKWLLPSESKMTIKEYFQYRMNRADKEDAFVDYLLANPGRLDAEAIVEPII